MTMNLVLATGLAYAFIGAMIMFISHRAIYRRAARIVAGYPKVLAALRAQRQDGRFGLVVLLSGNILQVLAAFGYSAPLAHWRYPAAFAAGALLLYGLWRLFVARKVASAAEPSERIQRQAQRRAYESRRSMVLLEAARREAANRVARERADGPRNRRVVYLAQEWECQWWSDKLGVSSAVLRATVRQVGPMVSDIERHLRIRTRGRYAVAA